MTLAGAAGGRALTTAILLAVLATGCGPRTSTPRTAAQPRPEAANTAVDHAGLTHTLYIEGIGHLSISWDRPSGMPGYVRISPAPDGALPYLVVGYSGRHYVSTNRGLWAVADDGTATAVFENPSPYNIGADKGPFSITSDLNETTFRAAVTDYAATALWGRKDLAFTARDPMSAGSGASNYYRSVEALLAPQTPTILPVAVSWQGSVEKPEIFTASPDGLSRTATWTLSPSEVSKLAEFATSPAVIVAVWSRWPLEP